MGYKLGNRSGLEWVLDQWKEHKISDPTVAARFNSYHFADHKEKVIELLQRVCTVSVETIKIVSAMPTEEEVRILVNPHHDEEMQLETQPE